jgi:adenylyltransferase/sulfurtransferase
VIGAGGLGSSALLYLAGSGIGTIGVCDGDELQLSNLHRQPLYSAKDLGKRKADLAAERLKELNPFIEVVSHPFRLTATNTSHLFSQYSLILDCTDNFRTKFLINDAAYHLQKPVIRASIYQFEGQIQTYLPERKDACLRCLWDEIPQEGCVGACQEVGVLGPVPGFFGVLQAVEAIKFFLKLPGLESQEILFVDLIHYAQRRIFLEKKQNCSLCGETPSIHQLSHKAAWEVESSDLNHDLCVLVDIRELEEGVCEQSCLRMPLSTFDASCLDPALKYVFFCQRGFRSAKLTSSLRAIGINNVFSLIGGVNRK